MLNRAFINAREIQSYGTVKHALPLDLEEPVRVQVTNQLNQLLADTMTLRDLYKKCHWQVAGPTFYQLHLLYDKHYGYKKRRRLRAPPLLLSQAGDESFIINDLRGFADHEISPQTRCI